jgi:hypothetical protein
MILAVTVIALRAISNAKKLACRTSPYNFLSQAINLKGEADEDA